MEGKGLKLLMTTDNVGGVWNYSLQLCKSLQEHGVEVHLASMGHWPSEEQQREASALPNVTLYKSDYKLEWMQDPWEDVEQAGKWLTAIYHTVMPDLIHFNNYAHLGRDWTCPTITVFHSCVETWWQAVNGTTAPDNWNRYKNTVSASLNSSDLVIAPTKAILESAVRSHSISSETKVIYNGRDLSLAEENEKEEIILCIGRIWDEAKNLRSLSSIARDLPWPIYVVGNNTNPNTGEQVEIENVNFLGALSQKEVESWMERAAIFVSPTKYEPFGLAILEAAGAGCALVLSQLETLQEIWLDAAVYFQTGNREETKQKILEIISNREMRGEMAEKAKKRAAAFSAEKMASEYFNTYQSLLAKNETNQLTNSI